MRMLVGKKLVMSSWRVAERMPASTRSKVTLGSTLGYGMIRQLYPGANEGAAKVGFPWVTIKWMATRCICLAVLLSLGPVVPLLAFVHQSGGDKYRKVRVDLQLDGHP